MIVYKIQRKSDGLFSTGGGRPQFTTKGKVWRNRGGLSNHVKHVVGDKNIYRDCEIISYEVVETETDRLSVSDWELTPATIKSNELHEKRRDDYAAKYQQMRILDLERQLKELKSR